MVMTEAHQGAMPFSKTMVLSGNKEGTGTNPVRGMLYKAVPQVKTASREIEKPARPQETEGATDRLRAVSAVSWMGSCCRERSSMEQLEKLKRNSEFSHSGWPVLAQCDNWHIKC